QVANPTDEPAIFFPEAKESNHNESADNEEYRKIKGDRGVLQGQPEKIILADESRKQNLKSTEGFYSYRNDAPAAVAKADAGAFRPGELPAPKAEPAAPPMSDSEKALVIATGKPKGVTRIEEEGQDPKPAPAPQPARKIIRTG